MRGLHPGLHYAERWRIIADEPKHCVRALLTTLEGRCDCTDATRNGQKKTGGKQ